MKISIIGSGTVGGQLAYELAVRNYSEIVMVDIQGDLAKGKALDIMESSSVLNFKGKVKGTGDYSDIQSSDVIVVTAGKAREPGMSREDLARTNISIARDVSEKIKNYSPESILILVTNPLDIISFTVYKATGFSPEKVIGMAGVLDTSRYKYFISEKTGKSVKDIDAVIIGPHGNSMVVTDKTYIKNKPLKEYLSEEEITQLKQRARNGGKEIVDLLKNSSAFFAPAASVARMIDSINNDIGKILPCSVHPQGKYDLGDLFIGLPVKLGRKGVKQVVEMDLNRQEEKSLKKAAREIEQKLKKFIIK